LVRDAMLQARAVFYADADVVFFQNPWPSVAASWTYDVVHQSAGLGDPRRMNGGVFVVHSLEFAEFALSQQPAAFNNSNALDQTIIYDAMIKSGRFRHSALPPSQFQSHCWVRCILSPMPPTAVAFHASCMGARKKLHAVQSALADYLSPRTYPRDALHPKCNGREIKL